MSRWAWAIAGSALLALAGCAGQHARPARHAAQPGTSAPGSASSHSGASRGPRDNLNLPQSQRYRLHHDTGPDGTHVDISKLSEPVPRPEPRSNYGNTSPYTVLGTTYHVLASDKNYDKRGIASWYGSKFNGYMTSSLEPYDMYKFTAASKTLPLPSWVRVTNLKNDKSVIVRVNDRGPFVANRLIDLSYAAAVRIGIWPKGTGLVEVQAIDPRHPQELPAPPVVSTRDHPAGSAHAIWLQIGAFADTGNAARVAAKLRQAHLGPVHTSRVTVHGRRIERVRLGPFSGTAAVDRASAAVARLGLPQPQVAVD